MVKKFLYYSLLILVAATLFGCKLSGTVTTSTGDPVEGVTITLNGEADLTGHINLTTTTDTNGEYEFQVPDEYGSYTITPSHNNYTFTPDQWSGESTVSNPVTSVDGIDFTGIFPEFELTGRVTTVTGAPLENVSIVLSGVTDTSTTTDSNGEYKFVVPNENANYTITPSMNNYNFNPEQMSVEISESTPKEDIGGLDFTGIFPEFELSGRVTTLTGDPLENVSIVLNGGTDASTTTNNNGEYIFVVPNENANYTITLSKNNYTFNPEQMSVEINESTPNEDIGGLDFKAFKNILTSGRVTTTNDEPLEGVTITLSGDVGMITTTDTNGDYEFVVPETYGSYIITPSSDNYAFDPERITVSAPMGDIGGIDFTATIVFSKIFGGDRYDIPSLVQQTTDGGYLVVGRTNSFGAGSYDAWLIKTDVNGNEEWNKTFGGSGSDSVSSVKQTSDAGYVIAGYTESYGAGSSDVWLIKTDADGNEEWNKTFGDDGKDSASSVKQTSDGGYIIAGYTESYGAGSSDAWLIKTDADGNEEWSKTFGDDGNDKAYCVQQTTDGGYILSGSRIPYGSRDSVGWLIKTDADGNEEWNKAFGTNNNDYVRSVQQTSDGGYIFTCRYQIIKTDANGDEEWRKSSVGGSFDYSYSVQQTTDGGYIVVGVEHTGRSYDFFLFKIDADGNGEWSRNFDGIDYDQAHSVQQTTDGGYIVVGYTGDYHGDNYEAWVLKTNSIGNTTSFPE